MKRKSRLAELQDEFFRSVLSGKAQIYSADYSARMVNALANSYHAVSVALGQEAFERIARAFVQRNGSKSHNLDVYGESFPEFLEGVSEAAIHPYLSELAAFERQFRSLYHQTEHAHASPESLALAGESSRLRFGAAVRLIRNSCAVAKVWSVRESSPETRKNVGWDTAERIVMYKNGGLIYLKWLEEPEFDLLEALREATPIADALAAISSMHPELDTPRVGKLFAFLKDSGIVEKVI